MLSDKLYYWLFQSRPELPALILEAQMGLPSIHAWQVVVITPSRQLNFGASEPVASNSTESSMPGESNRASRPRSWGVMALSGSLSA